MLGSSIQFEECLPGHPDAAALIAELNQHLSDLYRPEDNHFALEDAEVTGSAGVFLLARVDGTPAGCGAIRMADSSTGEIKRMWVRPEFQGKGIGGAILARLEEAAARRGALRLVLEMGDSQPAAATLYESAGFRPKPCWGEYLTTPGSICLEKSIEPLI